MLDSLVTRKTATTLPIVPVDAEELKKWKRARGASGRRWLAAHAFEAKRNRPLIVPDQGGRPELVLLGRTDESLWTWAGAAHRLPKGRYRLEGETDQATDAAIGWALAAYDFDRFRGVERPRPNQLVWPKGADRAEVRRVVEAIGWARDLINTPAEDLGPTELAAAVSEMGEAHGARVRILKGKRLADAAPAVLAVGRGSSRRPVLIDLRWGSPANPRVTLVGKGVCFDSGGLDMKRPAGMLRMKKDMGGAAIVAGLASMIMDADLPLCLRLLIPAVENLPGEGAYRPMDVLTTRSGKTVEVTNTDAEGRLVLADALHMAAEEEPELLIDVATLTGAARLAVGVEITPFFTPDRKIADALAKASRATRDPVWRLPLHRGYRRHLDSRVADMKNSASTHQGGAIIAALFLRDFVPDVEGWLHVDAYGWNDHFRPGRPTGGEATGLRALWRFVRDRCAE